MRETRPDPDATTRARLGVPETIAAFLFDLDGVLTSTATMHRHAWKLTFDEFLRARDGEAFAPFTEQDYVLHVDGMPRRDGVRGFLSSRGITLPEGSADDPHGRDTVHGVANRKNDLVEQAIREQGVDPYPDTVRFLQTLEQAGLPVGVVTSSANGARVLDAAGLTRFVRVRIDGLVIERDRLRGKPAPDSFLAGARALGVEPARTAVFEDALAGVEAGRAGGFGYVVGVDRTGQADALRAHGADVVITSLSQLLGPT